MTVNFTVIVYTHIDWQGYANKLCPTSLPSSHLVREHKTPQNSYSVTSKDLNIKDEAEAEDTKPKETFLIYANGS